MVKRGLRLVEGRGRLIAHGGFLVLRVPAERPGAERASLHRFGRHDRVEIHLVVLEIGLRFGRFGPGGARLVPILVVLVVVGEAGLLGGLILLVGLVAGVAVAPDGAKRLPLVTFHLKRIGAAASLQIEVLSYGIVK
jgi:hypothetical protein